MSQIPFKVSARAARLIGRENVSNPEGAIIELVKNCYDADASVCILYFDNRYANVPRKLNESEYEVFCKETQSSKIIEENYRYNKPESIYELKDTIVQSEYLNLYNFFHKKAALYIIDDGDGMTREIIENSWMTIGTNNKESNYKSNKGRIRTGAKGIGRFALDRLGNKGDMFTITENSKSGYEWHVNWSDFELNNTNIGSVFAELNEDSKLDLNAIIKKKLQDFPKLKETLIKNKFYKGTLIKISDLRDDWPDSDVKRVFANLEGLIPPKDPDENREFEIFLISSLNTEEYGEVSDAVLNDYDYKLYAKLNNKSEVEISIYRRE
ncbi:ATP-binding protein, partial [Anaerosolibacter sp.]|uniref:ATP-binding protein n=1 Tax=Anaerosolibacter sp. TaxID=1872527 RepID=UPI0039EF87F5